MKRLKFLFTTIGLLAYLTLYAEKVYNYSFKQNDVYYKIISQTSKTVKVTYEYYDDGDYYGYEGNVDIPSTVTYSGTTYTVTEIDAYCFYYMDGVKNIRIPSTITTIGRYAFGSLYNINSIICGCTTPPKITGSFPRNIKIAVPANSISAYTSEYTTAADYWKDNNFYDIASFVSEIRLSQYQTGTLKVGQTCNLTATKWPADISTPITWESSDPSVATVSNGVITAKGSGICYVYAKIGPTQEKCMVSVVNGVTKITPNTTTVNLVPGGSTKLSVSYTPTTADNRSVTWTSNNTSIASVTSDGTVTAKATGTATLTATTPNGTKATVTVTVTTLNSFTYNNIKYFLNGNNAYIRYSSSSGSGSDEVYTGQKTVSGAVTIPSTAIFTGTAYGSTTYTLSFPVTEIGTGAFCGNTSITSISIPTSVVTIGTEAFNGCTGLTSVNIPQSVKTIKTYAFYNCSGLTSVTFGDAKYNSNLSTIEDYAFSNCTKLSSVTSYAINAPSLPYSSGAYSFAFNRIASSSNLMIYKSSYSLYNSKGWISKFATVSYISIDATGITISPTTQSLKVGETVTLTPALTPSSATTTVTYSSSNSNIATVTSAGVVKGIASGTTTITAKAGSYSATCTITVTNPVTSISLNSTAATLWINGTKTLTVSYAPTNADNRTATWSSSNTNVATVSTAGVVTAKGKGTATITAQSANGKTATCFITVKQQVTSITLNKTSLSLTKGATSTLTATVTPSTASNTGVTWSSSNTAVATVSTAGVVTAVANGSATITCTASDGYGTKTTCNVTVTNPVTSISLNATSATLKVNETKTLTVTYNPTDADNRSVTWSSSNTNVATVSTSGVVTAVTPGSATITATTPNGKTAQCNITVPNYEVGGIFYEITNTSTKTVGVIRKDRNDNYSGDIIIPSTVTINNLVYSVTSIEQEAFSRSSSLSSVTIPNSVTTIGSGAFAQCSGLTSVIIPNSVTTIREEAFASCSSLSGVTIPNSVTRLEIGTFAYCTNLKEITLPSSITYIGTSVFYQDTNLKTVTCRATTVPTVDEYPSEGFNGFNGFDASSATLYVPASSVNAYKNADCWKTFGTIAAIHVPVTSVSLNKTSGTLWVNGTLQLTTTIAPSDASTKNVTWSSSNTSVATVSTSGLVTAKGKGTATITCTSTDNSTIKATCAITVKQQVTSVTLSKTALNIVAGKTATLTATAAPSTANNTAVNWSSSNTKVATVSGGTITAVAAGTATITATAADGYGTKSTCTVTVIARGDVDGSGTIDNADITADVKFVMGDTDVTGLYADAADYNNNGKVTSTDAIAIVRLALTQTTTISGAKAKGMNANTTSKLLAVDDINMVSSEAKEISIRLADNMDKFTNIMFDVALPEGVMIENVSVGSRTTDHSAVYSLREDGTVRVICYSLSNDLFTASDGDIVKLKLKADSGVFDGTYDIDFTNIKLVRKDVSSVTSNYETTSLNIGNTTGIGSVNVGDGKISASFKNGTLTITANEDGMASIYAVSGALVYKNKLKAGEKMTISVPRGVYIINGTKTSIK